MAELVPTVALYAKFIDEEIPKFLYEPHSSMQKDKLRGKAIDDLLHQYVTETRLARYGLPTRKISFVPSVSPPMELWKGGIWVYTDGVYEGLFEYLKFHNNTMTGGFIWHNSNTYIHGVSQLSYLPRSINQLKCQKIFDFAVAERELIVALLPVFSILPQPIGVKILKRILP